MASIGPHTTQHAIDRALERYGVLLDADDIETLVMDIIASVDGDPRAILMDQSNGIEVWWVKVRGHDMRVVYGPVTASIVTVLPLRNKKDRLDGGRQR